MKEDFKSLGWKAFNLKRVSAILTEIRANFESSCVIKIPTPTITIPVSNVENIKSLLYISNKKEDRVLKDINRISRKIYRNFVSAQKLILRSSALVEDTKQKSWAGIFKSCPVKNDLYEISHGLLDIIRDVLKKEQVLDTKIPIAIIVQPLIDSIISGIMFTSAGKERNRYLLIEYVYFNNYSLVSGETPPEAIVIYDKEKRHLREFRFGQKTFSIPDLENRSYKSCILTDEHLKELSLPTDEIHRLSKCLINIGQHIENKLHHPCDIEYTISQDKEIYILQVRPLTASKITFDYLYNNRDNLRKTAVGVGWKIPRYGMVEIDMFLKDNRKFPKKKVYSIRLEKERDGLVGSKEYLFNNLSSIPKNSLILVEEFIQPEISGNISIINGNTAIVEIIFGHIIGLTRGIISPSKYIIRDEKLISSETKKQNVLYYISDKGIVSKKISPKEIKIPTTYLKQLYVLARKFDELLPNSVIEFGLRENKVIFFDATISTLKIEAVRELKGIVKKPESNNEVESAQNIVHSYENFVRMYIKKDTNNEKYIYVLPKPELKFAKYIPYAQAFIFKEGSLLCHLMVLLRELHIPSIINENLYEKLKDGEYVSFGGEPHENT